MARSPGPRKPARNFEAEQRYADSGVTPEQAKAIQSLRAALMYYRMLSANPNSTATQALEADDKLHAPTVKP